MPDPMNPTPQQWRVERDPRAHGLIWLHGPGTLLSVAGYSPELEAWSKVAALLNQAANLRSLLRDVREGLEQVRQVIDFSEFREIQPFSYVGIVEAFDKLLSRIDSQEEA